MADVNSSRWRRPSPWLWAVLLVLTALPAPRPATAGDRPEEVFAWALRVRGEVLALQDKISDQGRLVGRDWVRLSKGLPLLARDEVQTGASAQVVLQLNDWNEETKRGGTEITIGEGSRVALSLYMDQVERSRPRHRMGGTLELIRGTIRSLIKGWGQTPTSNFWIRAGVAVCSLRGSDATIEYDPEVERLTVTVQRGEVTVAGPTGSTFVRTGETARFDAGGPVDAPPPS